MVKEISLVIPVFKCASCLVALVDSIEKFCLDERLEFEIVLVDDRSPDDAWDIIRKLKEEKQFITGIRLSRNFGQHNAIFAGLEKATKEWIVVLDCDLQDDPFEIKKMISIANTGYDMVVGLRSFRKDSWLKIASGKIFYRLLSYLCGEDIDPRICNFGIYSSRVIACILAHNEINRSFGGLAILAGFNRAHVEVAHRQRFEGKSSYSLDQMFKLASDRVILHSKKILELVFKSGILISISSSFYALWLVFKFFAYGVEQQGWTSLMVLVLLCTGLIVMSLGIVGGYIGSVLEQVKRRPHYWIDEEI